MELLNNANLIQEEPKKVCFNYDLFLNLEGNPPVNHLRCEKLTFNNPTRDFRRKLVKAGGVSAALWEMELFVARFKSGKLSYLLLILYTSDHGGPRGGRGGPETQPRLPHASNHSTFCLFWP